jgi:hypothetical protein
VACPIRNLLYLRECVGAVAVRMDVPAPDARLEVDLLILQTCLAILGVAAIWLGSSAYACPPRAPICSHSLHSQQWADPQRRGVGPLDTLGAVIAMRRSRAAVVVVGSGPTMPSKSGRGETKGAKSLAPSSRR